MSTFVLIAVPAIGFAAVLLLAGLCAAAGRADAHLDAMRDADTFPHRAEPGDGTPGPAHPLYNDDWVWPPAIDYHRERRQG